MAALTTTKCSATIRFPLRGGKKLSLCNQGFRDRFTDEEDRATLGNQEACLYMRDQLTSMGLSVTTQGLYQNVVGEKQGAVTPDQIYIVCGHYDTLEGSVDDERPGGEDNASGTAGTLEVARVLSQYEFESIRHSVPRSLFHQTRPRVAVSMRLMTQLLCGPPRRSSTSVGSPR